MDKPKRRRWHIVEFLETEEDYVLAMVADWP